jgi:hypothetical protein
MTLHRVDLQMYLQHHFCMMHIYCRLLDLGVPKAFARPVCRALEPVVKLLIY